MISREKAETLHRVIISTFPPQSRHRISLWVVCLNKTNGISALRQQDERPTPSCVTPYYEENKKIKKATCESSHWTEQKLSFLPYKCDILKPLGLNQTKSVHLSLVWNAAVACLTPPSFTLKRTSPECSHRSQIHKHQHQQLWQSCCSCSLKHCCKHLTTTRLKLACYNG